MDIIHRLTLGSLPKMQAQSFFLLNTLKGLRPNSESRLPKCPLLEFQYQFEKKRTAKANPTARFCYQSETLKKKCKTLTGTHWFLSRDFLNICGPFHSAQGHASHQDGSRQMPWVPPARFQGGRRGRPCQARRALGQAMPIFPAELACGEGGASFGLRPGF